MYMYGVYILKSLIFEEDDLKTNRENTCTRKMSSENTTPNQGLISDSSTEKEHLPDSHKDNGGGQQSQENIEEEKEQPAKSRVEGVDSSRHDYTEGHRPETAPRSHTDPPALVTEKTCWQWKDPDGQWITYPSEVQEKLRKNFQKNPRSTVLITQNASL